MKKEDLVNYSNELNEPEMYRYGLLTLEGLRFRMDNSWMLYASKKEVRMYVNHYGLLRVRCGCKKIYEGNDLAYAVAEFNKLIK